MRLLSSLFLLTGLVLAGAGPEVATPAQRGWRGSRFQSGRTPVQIYAHRGGRSYAPEGTLMAYAVALRMGVDFVDLDVSGLRPPEILLLTYCITLTPGTVSIRLSDDYRTLTVHALDGADPEGIRREVRRQLIQPILAFTR